MTHASEPLHIDARGLMDLLRSATMPEGFSALTGLPLVFVHLDDGVPTDVPDLLEPALLSAVCVFVGVASQPLSPRAGRLATRLDAVLEDPSSLETVAATVRRSPVASASLALLLRQELYDRPLGGLVAESALYSALQAGPEFARWLAPRSDHGGAEDDKRLTIRRVDDVLYITLARPARHNALDAKMRDYLHDALLLAMSEPSLRVVLDGSGPSFCSGGDLAEFGSSSDPASAHVVRLTHSLARLLLLLGPRTESRVHGVCIGAGVELPAFTHRMVGAEDSLFALPELGMGLIPGAGGTVSLPRRIGRQRTLLLALHGHPISASIALRWGLLDAIEEQP